MSINIAFTAEEKKENQKAYVLISVTQVEQIPNVKQLNL